MLSSRAWAAWAVVAVMLASADNDVVDVGSDIGMLEPQLGASLGNTTHTGAVVSTTTAPTAAASSGGTPPAASNAAAAPTNASAMGNGIAVVASVERPAKPDEAESTCTVRCPVAWC